MPVVTPEGELLSLGENGIFRFRVMTDPSPPILGDYFSVWSTVERVDTKVSAGTGKLSFDATMPEHKHGMTTLSHTRLHDDGRYRTTGCRLHMHGRWVFELSFKNGEASDRTVIEFPFRPPAVRRPSDD
ncbi:MAG: hypothetical protein QF412_06445 [Planctomycetota bacterium]|nr:hypothetical protein [Planctomycetota bacterium]